MGVGPSLANEEEILSESNTPPVTRILPKNYDPRSPSEGITRTPIEVNTTPKSNFRAQASLFNTPTISKSSTDVKSESSHLMNLDESDLCQEIQTETEDKKELNDDVVSDLNPDVKDEVVVTKFENAQKKTNGFKKQLTYLETDVDAFSSNLLIEHPRITQLRSCEGPVGLVANENNSTSNTVSSLDDTVEADSFLSRIEGLSFTDVSLDDPSFSVSEFDNDRDPDECNGPTKAISEWLITIEDDSHTVLPFDISTDSEDRVVSMQKQCVTPDQKIKSTKERTPLGCLVQNRVYEPVKETSNLNKKQWRGIEEERARRGLLCDENTPPMLPPVLDKVSSAPGKLMRRRRNIEWDKDDATIMI